MKTKTNKKAQKKFEMEPFDNHDWDCYNGAEDFADGSEPLIGCKDVKVTDVEYLGNVDAVVIADANGVQILGEGINTGLDRHFPNQDAARRFVGRLINADGTVELEKLTDYGFKAVI